MTKQITFKRTTKGTYTTADGRFLVESILQAGCVSKTMAWGISDRMTGTFQTQPTLSRAREIVAVLSARS